VVDCDEWEVRVVGGTGWLEEDNGTVCVAWREVG
jgi:hypothetical protein